MQHTINGIPYMVETSGSGEWHALFLHYFGGEGQTWHEVMGRLPNMGCVAPDMAGFGSTPAPKVAYTVSQHAADMLALIEHMGLNDFALVGHSMGGKIALALAALQPRGLKELVLVAPSPPTPEPMEDRDRTRMLKAHGDRAAIEQQIGRITANTLPANLFEQAVGENLRTSASAWQAWLEEGSREDISPLLAQIHVPVAILVGERDPVIAPALITREVTPYLVGTTAKVSVVPNAGHLLPYEAPQTIADALTNSWRQ